MTQYGNSDAWLWFIKLINVEVGAQSTLTIIFNRNVYVHFCVVWVSLRKVQGANSLMIYGRP